MRDRSEAVDVPRCATAEGQLSLARARRTALRGLEGEAREIARRRAVEAYRAVGRFHPTEPSIVAEAHFRAGELLRAGGDSDAAMAEFRTARDAGGGTPFRARAELEVGHLFRREGLDRAALGAYLSVAQDASAARSHRDEATLYVGRAWSALGFEPEARAAWNRVADGGQCPLDRVDAYDRLALSHVAAGEADAAAALLSACRVALADVALELTTHGERVRRALDSMRAVDELRALVRERFAVRRRSHSFDAQR